MDFILKGTHLTIGHALMPMALALQTEQVLGGTRSTRADAEVLADQSVVSHYRRLTGKDTASTSLPGEGPAGLASKQRPIEGECAICYDSLNVSRFLTCCWMSCHNICSQCHDPRKSVIEPCTCHGSCTIKYCWCDEKLVESTISWAVY